VIDDSLLLLLSARLVYMIDWAGVECVTELYWQVFHIIPDLPHLTRALVDALMLLENTGSVSEIQETCVFMSIMVHFIRSSGAPILGVYRPAYS